MIPQRSMHPESADAVIDVRKVTKRFKLYRNPVLGPIQDLLFFWRKEKQYRDHLAVHDASFTIRRGEVVGIVGPNGAGKTTILKMIAGLLPVDQGAIHVKGKVTALLALGVGVHPEFTGRENIFFGGLLLGMSKEEVRAKTESIIEFAEIGQYIDQPFRTYSSGMRARLLFAISMSIDPEILIVDEALATGDIAFVRKCEARIKSLCRSGATVLFVSHNMAQVLNLCDRSILMMNGKVEFDGSPQDAFEAYRRMYVDAENSRLMALRENEHFHLVNGTGKVTLTDVILTDAEGNPGQSFFTGKPATLELRVSRSTDCGEFFVFVGFYSGNQYVGHIDTEHVAVGESMESHRISASRYIRFEMSQLVMLNGVYSMRILFLDASDRHVMADYFQVAPFRVSKEHHPFDADAYFSQPLQRISYE